MLNQDVQIEGSIERPTFDEVESVNGLISEKNEDESALEIKLAEKMAVEEGGEVNVSSPDFRLYQFVLFVMTQVGYFAVAGSMLSTTFLEPSKATCNLLSQFLQNRQEVKPVEFQQNVDNEDYESFRLRVLSKEFHSLSVEWREECGDGQNRSSLLILAPTLLMFGAIVGSFAAGFLADRFGRKPVVVGSLLIVCLTNAAISALGDFYLDVENSVDHHHSLFCWWRHFWGRNSSARYVAVFSAMFVLGAACGGYMVTNVVFLVEALHNSARLRLLVVALNGWPLGMIFTALVGALSAHWRIYHLIMSASAILVVTLLEIFSLESFHWHYYRGDHHLAAKVHNNIQKRYTKSTSYQNSTSQLMDLKLNETAKKEKISYSYLDLFRHSNIFIPLAQLSYCFFSASVVSYGLFFSVDSLPGNRYANLAAMGLGKLTLGFASFLMSFRIGRRPIMITSLSIACVLCWILLALLCVKDTTEIGGQQLEQNVFVSENISIIVAKNSTSLSQQNQNYSQLSLVTWLALALTAILDPTWKVNHLFSMELFPIQVRNMSRGLCNVAARIGSMAGPLVIYMRSLDESYPFWMFSILLTLQWIVSLTLPETKDRDLLREMPTPKTRKTEKLVEVKALINEGTLSSDISHNSKMSGNIQPKTIEKVKVKTNAYTENRRSG